jgi:DNA-binding XRE family transcriptional regulator
MAPKKIMTSVITGDIIHSRQTNNALWLPRLKKALSLEGKSPGTWEVYRGDSFQIEVKDPANAFLTAIRIKAAIKTVKNLDVRMAIGIGDKKFSSSKVAESDGEAFLRSGEKFETLKKLKQTLAIKTAWPAFDRDMNVFFRLASIPMDNWTITSAELIQILATQKKLTQKALAKRLGVTQPSISERQNRSHYDEVMELEHLFREKVFQLMATK